MVSSVPIDVWILWTGLCSPTFDTSDLSPHEIARGMRYRSVFKRRQFFLSRILGRRVISATLAIPSSEIEWPITGAPRLESHSKPLPLSVSLSHTGEYIALAVGPPDVTLGIDLEETNSPVQVASLAGIAFTQRERLLLSEVPGDLQPDWCRQLWTAKEAALKSLASEAPPEMSSLDLSELFNEHRFCTGKIPAEDGTFIAMAPLGVGLEETHSGGVWEFSLTPLATHRLHGTLAIRLPMEKHAQPEFLIDNSVLEIAPETFATEPVLFVRTRLDFS